jgi:hypothetical protein
LEEAAMSVTEADIKRMKTELRRDLDALERVEAMLQRHSSIGHSSNGHTNPSIGSAPPSVPNGSGRDLRGIVLKILNDARLSQKSLRPSEIARLAQNTDYPFKSHKNAMGSVTKVLTRLLRKQLVDKKGDGTYLGK